MGRPAVSDALLSTIHRIIALCLLSLPLNISSLFPHYSSSATPVQLVSSDLEGEDGSQSRKMAFPGTLTCHSEAQKIW